MAEQNALTSYFPDAIRGFVGVGASALGCDQSYIGVPLLAVLASAIGNTRRIRLKDTWTEPAVVWTAIVGDSGTVKSPALELAVLPQRLGDRAARMAWRIVSNKSTPGRLELPPVPVVKDNAGSYSAWQNEPPEHQEIPWKSDLVLEVKREE